MEAAAFREVTEHGEPEGRVVQPGELGRQEAREVAPDLNVGYLVCAVADPLSPLAGEDSLKPASEQRNAPEAIVLAEAAGEGSSPPARAQSGFT
ncbi:MAG TPA: hypothetical protein VGD74_06495 [Vulgatibacter sp.]